MTSKPHKCKAGATATPQEEDNHKSGAATGGATVPTLVASYRVTDDGTRSYYGRLLSSEKAPAYVLTALSLGRPDLGASALPDLAAKLSNGFADLEAGRIVDIQLVLATDDGLVVFGMHRAPHDADITGNSILALAIDAYGAVVEMRMRPNAQSMEGYASTFAVR